MSQNTQVLQPGDPEYERLIKIRDDMLVTVRSNVYEDNQIHALQKRAEKRGE